MQDWNWAPMVRPAPNMAQLMRATTTWTNAHRVSVWIWAAVAIVAIVPLATPTNLAAVPTSMNAFNKRMVAQTTAKILMARIGACVRRT